MPTTEERLARLEGYFQDVITGNHPRWRAKHMDISQLSDITPNLGDITFGNAMFGQAFNRSIGFGDDFEAFWARDLYNRFYFRVGYTADYFRLGRPDRPGIEYDGEEVYTDGLTIRKNTIPYTAMVVGPIAYNLLGHDKTDFGCWHFSEDEIYSTYVGRRNITMSGQTGSIASNRLDEYDIDVKILLHDGTLSVFNISSLTDYFEMASIEYVNIDADIDVGEPGRTRRVHSYMDDNYNVHFRNMDALTIGIVLGNYQEDLAYFKNSALRLGSTYNIARLDQTLDETVDGDVTLTLEVTNNQTHDSIGSLTFDSLTWAFSHPITIPSASADPANPSAGEAVIWVSDGTGSGDAGDVMIKITAGTTKTHTLVDFSVV